MLTTNRLSHSLGVANKMRKLVLQSPGAYDISPNEAFVLGLLHDVGYGFTTDHGDHAFDGGELLKLDGYKYWQEVFYHGRVQDDYHSNVLNLLNYVDVTVGPIGEDMSIDERLADIVVRYGKISVQFITAVKLAESLKDIF